VGSSIVKIGEEDCSCVFLALFFLLGFLEKSVGGDPGGLCGGKDFDLVGTYVIILPFDQQGLLFLSI
jgi:hypothetical protein